MFCIAAAHRELPRPDIIKVSLSTFAPRGPREAVLIAPGRGDVCPGVDIHQRGGGPVGERAKDPGFVGDQLVEDAMEELHLAAVSAVRPIKPRGSRKLATRER